MTTKICVTWTYFFSLSFFDIVIWKQSDTEWLMQVEKWEFGWFAEELRGPVMGKNRNKTQKLAQEQEQKDEEEKNKEVYVAHYKDYACVQLLHLGNTEETHLSLLFFL